MSVRRDGLQRRDAILDAALRCFTRSGLIGTGIEAIRREAGASPSSMYHQFADLRALTLALLIRTCERLFGSIAAAVAKTDNAEALVKTLVSSHLDWVLEHPDEARFMYQALTLELSPAAAETVQARKAELLQPIALRFVPHIAAGALPAWPPILFDVVLVGPSHEACRRYLAGAPLDPGWMRSELPRLAWQAVSQPGDRAR